MQLEQNGVQYEVTQVDGQPALWIGGSTCRRLEAVGEAYNPQQMSRVVALAQGRTDFVLPAWLMHEPSNAHDPNAVMIWILGGCIGYLPRDEARLWAPMLQRLRALHNGLHVACRATLDPPSTAKQGGFGIVVWLPTLHPAIVAAPPPAPKPPPPVPPRTPATPMNAVAQVQDVPAAAAPPALSVEQLAELKKDLSSTMVAIARAKAELESVEESLEIQSFGFYQPKYGFESSEDYTKRLVVIRDQQQLMIKADRAAPCDTKWTVGGSAAAGKKMVKQQAKLMLRAFNGECDAAIAKVKYDNVTKLEDRLRKAYADINKLGEVQQVVIAQDFFDLKLSELHLVHEHREKVHEEKEEQKRIREQMREEQRADEEIAKANAVAEQEEAKSTAALAKARAELEASTATSKQHDKLEQLVGRLENELKSALDQKAKAIARAQLTRSGHVYVLSNIGSFGQNVYKIGMTRRLDPYERVDELGDASVPFPFDVHAIIFAEDAPALEHRLHKAFAGRRVNVVNHRKEYFNVTLKEIEAEVETAHGLVTFQLVPHAEEYNKTLAARGAGKTAVEVIAPSSNPEPESGVIAIGGAESEAVREATG